MGRALYRVQQFVETFVARPTPEGLSLARQILTPQQMMIFNRLQASEQAHAIRVLQRVEEICQTQGFETPADLRVAALLHDVGKARVPLRVWERVMIVLGKAILPERAARWGTQSSNGSPRGVARPFVVAAHHPAWGADFAAEQGTTPRAVSLIRRHQDQIPALDSQDQTEEDYLLAILQAVDDKS